MSVIVKGLEMPETEYMDVRIFRDGTVAIATGTKPYYRKLKAETVRHGKWISHGDCGVTECSCCGWNIEECVGWNYCPECGARMDKDD